MTDSTHAPERLTIQKAYLLGFMASGEGWNSEYPFGQYRRDPENDEEWCKQRDLDLAPGKAST